MKSTMNKRDIAKYHKMLNNDVKIEKISKYLGVTQDTLGLFEPATLAQAKVDKGVKTSTAPKKAAKKSSKKAAAAEE